MRHDTSPRGQVLIIFAFAFAVIIMLLALLLDGARGVVLRRQMQDASDASALAAANIIPGLSPKGCSATWTPGSPPGAPQTAVVNAAKASIAANLPGYDTNLVQVSCPDGWQNLGVFVTIGDTSPSFFGSIFGGGQLSVHTRSTAIHGPFDPFAYNVVLLNPSNLGWAGQVNGCPSFAINGGITAKFDQAIYVDSFCTAANGGAFASKGGSASLTFGPGASMRLAGEWKPQALTVTPAPLEHQDPLPDPFYNPPKIKPAPPAANMTVRRTSKTTINGTAAGQCTGNGLIAGTNGCVLLPGVYVGGIDLKSSATLYLRPGVYVLKDGGLSLGSQSQVFSVPATSTGTTAANWATHCVPASCGVLIYKTNGGTNGGDQISVTAGATFMLRSFRPEADTTVMTGGVVLDGEEYRNILMWQDRNPVPTSSYQQPVLQLQGGGSAVLGGTIYAPSAKVQLGGTPGGSGGTVNLTLQFIAWDLELSGNASFHFIYSVDSFARPISYGLVE